MAERTDEAIADLPLAGARTFRTLDEYLAFRAEQGKWDAPCYTEVEPGVYELWGGRRPPGVTPPRFTRAQLMAEFGFKQ
jgi:hypothetical protein